MPRAKVDLNEKWQRMTEYERKARQEGFAVIAGMDEVGRGPLAGPVVTCCLILDPDKPVLGVDDSKKLSHKRRMELKAQIEETALAIGIGVVDHTTIDRINILNATKMAMKMAVRNLKIVPDLVMIDAVHIDDLDLPQLSIIKGDAKSVSIAAASIVAKETRDRMMEEYDKLYPGYGFAQNKGYGTKEHMEALKKLGPCPIHRSSFIHL
jgi:ribonuclease HII